MKAAIRELFGRLRGVRNLGTLVLVAALAMAALLLYGGHDDTGGEPPGTALESRMEAVLSQIEGAGRVVVLLREKDAQPAFGGGQADPGAGRVEGVVVVSEGAGDVRVALELARAVKALLGVDMARIEVLRMERSERG